ncbi:L-lactate permease [Collimonas arenae]|uniref:L-lactate permease n=1 Tax=Collimonas arenae TaxID=279058 RepID=A0A0A1FAP9_9BURK|nr:hypothetical protein [Collimonas arenae]AIY41798.1 L-lactate permease [Collimonas arenae]
MKKLYSTRINPEMRVICAIFLLLLSGLIYFYQRVFLPDYFFIDEKTITDLIRYTDLDISLQDSFTSTAMVYAVIGPEWSQILLLLATGAVIVYVCKRSYRLIDLLFAFLLMLSFALFNLKLSKEVIVIVLNLVACSVCAMQLSNRKKMMIIVSLYLLYAWKFRVYYAVIAVLMLALHVVAGSRGKLRVCLIVGMLLLCCAIPGDFWDQLQQARDVANANREGLSDSKTMFTNFLAPSGVLTVLPNALFAAMRFYFAPLFSVRAQEIILSSTLWLLTLVMFKRGNRSHPLFLLVAANFVIQTFFEPDLGSFFRHLSAYAFCVFGIRYLAPDDENPSPEPIAPGQAAFTRRFE